MSVGGASMTPDAAAQDVAVSASSRTSGATPEAAAFAASIVEPICFWMNSVQSFVWRLIQRYPQGPLAQILRAQQRPGKQRAQRGQFDSTNSILLHVSDIQPVGNSHCRKQCGHRQDLTTDKSSSGPPEGRHDESRPQESHCVV